MENASASKSSYGPVRKPVFTETMQIGIVVRPSGPKAHHLPVSPLEGDNHHCVPGLFFNSAGQLTITVSDVRGGMALTRKRRPSGVAS